MVFSKHVEDRSSPWCTPVFAVGPVLLRSLRPVSQNQNEGVAGKLACTSQSNMTLSLQKRKNVGQLHLGGAFGLCLSCDSYVVKSSDKLAEA